MFEKVFILPLLSFLPSSSSSPLLVVRGPHYTAQDGFKLAILLLQPPECWDYRYELL
jgi:hypothetical protein